VPVLRVRAGGGAEIPAHFVAPSVGSGPFPGVVVVHDALGLTDVAREHAGRLAAAGYLAVVPDLYGRGGRLRCVRSVFADLAHGQGLAFEDLEAVRGWLQSREDCTGRVGVIGFCMGGGFALMTANRGFAAASPNYGPLPRDLDAALEGACPIVASYGARDRTLKGAAATLEAALARHGVPHDVKEYPEAGHSFMDRFGAGPLSPVLKVAGFGYHQPSAEDAWARILAFFDRYLRSGQEPGSAASP
jgi:carboxymethylenebutenolidase